MASARKVAASSAAAAVSEAFSSVVGVMGMRLVVSGLPMDATLGDVEALVMPKCSGRIVSIGLQSEGMASVEFAELADVHACLGVHELLGKMVRFSRPGDPAVPIMQQPAAAIVPASKRQRAAVEPVLPPPVEIMPLPSADVAGSSSSFDAVGSSYDGSALVVAAAPPMMEQSSSTASAQQSVVVDVALADAPLTKKQRAAEAKKEKERRLNRVGLSYRCGRCGQPKKGHVCVGGPEGGAAVQPPVIEGISPGSEGSSGANRTPPGVSPNALSGISPTGGWDLDSDSIFKDIKSVLQTPAGSSSVAPPPPAKPSNANGARSRCGIYLPSPPSPPSPHGLFGWAAWLP